MKTNITDLATNTLDTLDKVRTVTFNWNSSPNTNQQIGFIAQDIQQYYPDLVYTDPKTGYLSVNYEKITPVLVESIRELNLKLTNIQTFATSSDTTFLTYLENWLGSATNGVKDFFAGKVHTQELCVGDSSSETCITKAQLDQLLSNQNTQPSVPVITPPVVTPDPSTGDQTPTVTPPVITPDPTTQTPTVTPPVVTPPVTPDPTAVVTPTPDPSDPSTSSTTSN